uniref:Uncharacterized protein n=1 Tax=Ciona intestinalis TaxID=7719 RepID=H2Y2Q2_CIOIN
MQCDVAGVLDRHMWIVHQISIISSNMTIANSGLNLRSLGVACYRPSPLYNAIGPDTNIP